MADAVVHSTGPIPVAARRVARAAESLARWLARLILARATQRALSGLPDDVLCDIGLTRSEIPFVVGSIASQDGELRRDALSRIASPVMQQSAPPRLLKSHPARGAGGWARHRNSGRFH